MEGATAQRAVADARDRGVVVGVACVVAIALASWHAQSLQPGAGGDWNWMATLAYAAEHRLRFGSQIVWTYGPLGFLTAWRNPVLYYDDLLPWSWSYAWLLQLLLAGSLLIALRRSLPLLVAVPLAAVVVVVTTIGQAPALGLTWCVLLLARDDDALGERLAALLPAALGVLAGLTLLGKLNDGVEIVVLATLTLIAERRRRATASFAAALLASAAAGWFATGQTLVDAWPYLRYGAEVVAGFPDAMAKAEPRYAWSYPAALALVGLALAFAWRAGRASPRSRRVALLAVCALYAGFACKEGFVRQDEGHLQVLFGQLAVLVAVLPVRGRLRPAAVAAIAGCVVAFGMLSDRGDFLRMMNPYANARAAAEQLQTAVSPSRRAALERDWRRGVAGGYGVTPAALAAVRGHTLMLWPFLYGDVPVAYGLRFRPPPTLEPYEAYTPALDRLGGRLLASPGAPERIMRANAPALDGRYATFEAPLTTLAIFCRYRQVLVGGPWQVLARSPDRCGSRRRIETVTARWGEPVPVPRPRDPGAAVLARIGGVGPQGIERLRALVLRPDARSIVLDGSPYRLVGATAGDGLLLEAPAERDYRAPFAMAPDPLRIAVRRAGGQPHARIHVTFEEVPLRGFPRAG